MTSQEHSSRYGRQVLFGPIGTDGQQKLGEARAVLVGCGALGTLLAEQLVRAGVGSLRLVDRDIVELSNLGRQALYTTEDAKEGRPKATALAGHLETFNPEVEIEARVADLTASNAASLLGDRHLILDGCDNLDTRYLLNDFAVSQDVPWIYGACVGARGLTATIIPGETPCLRCLFPEPPPTGATETCDTAGIIGPAAAFVATLQAVEALKLLVGDRNALRRTLLSVELWPFRLAEIGGDDPVPVPDCPACGERTFPFLDGTAGPRTMSYCGRDSVQILPAPGRSTLDLDSLEQRLRQQFTCRRNEYVLRVEIPGHTLTVFDDGRALVSGTGNPDEARSIYDRYVGS